jgi:hypothetical protein
MCRFFTLIMSKISTPTLDSLLNSCSLEISGIFKGDINSLERRFKEKSKQTNISDSWNYPAYVSVTAFGQPISKFNLKNT